MEEIGSEAQADAQAAAVAAEQAQTAAQAAATLRLNTADAAADALGDIIEAVAEVDRMIAAASGVRAVLLEQASQWSAIMAPTIVTAEASESRRREFARRSLVAELATACHLSEFETQRRLYEAETLVGTLPATLAILRSGEIAYRHAQVIVDAVRDIPDDQRATFDTAVAERATQRTPTQLKTVARRLRERMHPESITTRTHRAFDGRRVDLEPACDGMAWLSAYLPAADAFAIDVRLTGLARRVQTASVALDETRTRAQLRCDFLTDLLLGNLLLDNRLLDDRDPSSGPEVEGADADGTDACGSDGVGSDRARSDDDSVDGDGVDNTAEAEVAVPSDRTASVKGVPTTVLVTVPVLTLLGRSDEPGDLDGYGPIDPDTARRLAAGAPSFHRILTHPETGAVLSFGSTTYRVPEDLKRWLRHRDGTCRFSCCTRRAGGCEIDHTLPWQFGGPTDHDNLAHLCVKHHQLKHSTTWKVTQGDVGAMIWTSPHGREHVTFPEVPLRAKSNGDRSGPSTPTHPIDPADPARPPKPAGPPKPSRPPNPSEPDPIEADPAPS